MPASSLIFLVIITLVAAHVLPNQIRKHRRTVSARQADRDSDAMRVVVRRGAAPVGQALAAAAVNAAVASSSSRPVLGRGPGSVAVQSETISVPLKPLRRSNSRVVARRRRLVGTSAALVLLGWALVLAGLAPWWSGAVPTVGLLLVVAALGRYGAAAPAPVAVPAPVVLPAMRQPRSVTVPVLRDERPSPLAGDRGWEPVPVPLPTYLLKDRARTWDPVSPAVAAARLREADVEETRVLDLREHARVVNQ